MIPVFALGRAQELLLILGMLGPVFFAILCYNLVNFPSTKPHFMIGHKMQKKYQLSKFLGTYGYRKCFVLFCLFVGWVFFLGGRRFCVDFSCFSCLIVSMCFSKLIQLKKDVTVML